MFAPMAGTSTRHRPYGYFVMLSRLKYFGLAFVALMVILGCRAADAVITTRAGATMVAVDVPPTSIPSSTPIATEIPPELQTATQSAIDDNGIPTDEPNDTGVATVIVTATRAPSPTQLLLPTPTRTATRPLWTPTITRTPTITLTPTPSSTFTPTTSPYKYRAVQVKKCEPDYRNTIIEGTVYANGQPENGVIVRISLSAGGYQLPGIDSFISGDDPLNPGRPDPQHPGRYVYQILAGGPQEGNWWVFLVDKAGSKGKQISEAVFVHTNDGVQADSCQHAYIDFVRP